MTDTGPLVVPVDVQAMVLNGANANFIRSGMSYGQLATLGNPAPQPFQSDAGDTFSTDTRNLGVYLMWTLPKALRHGEQQPDGTVTFPNVPNRWLVVRLHRADASPAGTAPTTTAWVVESDFLDPQGGTSPYVDPRTPSKFSPTLIGRRSSHSSANPWKESSAASSYFLQAVSESNPAFAAYQPYNENVFSIHDDLATQGLAAGTLSYYVIGWYSQASADLLAGWPSATPPQTFSDLLDELSWSATHADAQTAIASIYQGATFGVPWQLNGPTIPSSKDGVMPQVAVGSGSVDGVVAFARAAFDQTTNPPKDLTPQQAVDLLEAFQYNLLPMLGKPGAEAQVEQMIRALWFGSAHGGTSWTIVDAETAPGATPAPPPTPAELAVETSWLAALNDAQAQFDATVRTLAGTQRELWELWWKQSRATKTRQQPWNVPADKLLAQINDRANTSRTLMGNLQSLGAQIPLPTATVTLSSAITGFTTKKALPANRVLKAVSEPRFWAPTDPVLVVSNTTHLLRIDPDTALGCRWSTELMTSLAVSAAAAGGTAFTVTAAQLAPLLPALPWSGLPALAPALFAELFLVDPVNAPLLAKAAGQQLSSAQLSAVAASMTPPVAGDAQSVVPAVVPAMPWSQPWQPMFLDWQIGWYSIPFTRDDGTPNWEFNGLDYDLVPNVPAPKSPASLLSGRAVLTPKPSFEFKSRIEQFIQDYPDSPAAQQLKEMDTLIESVDSWDFLSQSLGGLHTLVSGWNPVPAGNPDATPIGTFGAASDLIGDQALMPPFPVSPPPRRPSPPPVSRFEGIRAGQLYVNRLTLVDAFGQTLETVFAPQVGDTMPRTADKSVFHPLLADGVAPTQPIVQMEPLRFAQLPPRMLQPARLNFDLVAGDNGNPIVGWVIPNHLDAALSVYGADGTGYGELRVGVDVTGKQIVVWSPAPNSPHPTLPPASSATGALDSFLANLAALGPAALSDLLQSVDETLWTVDPLGNRADSFLSVLIGRPLAVVTASLSYELQTRAWRDTDWPYTIDPRPEPLFVQKQYDFPVRLGDLGYRQDGLIGYFVNGNYTSFNAIHLPGEGDAPRSGYLKQIAAGNYVNLTFAASGAGTPVSLTMLLDPRGSVHAQCALFPMKEITLPQQWVDSAMETMVITFRVGPVVVGTQTVVPPKEQNPVTSLLLTSPSERKGTWSWMELDPTGAWAETPLAPVDGTAQFPDTPPTLREGLLELSGGLES